MVFSVANDLFSFEEGRDDMKDIWYFSIQNRYQRKFNDLYHEHWDLGPMYTDGSCQEEWDDHVKKMIQAGLGPIGFYTAADSDSNRARALTILLAPHLSLVRDLCVFDARADTVTLAPPVKVFDLGAMSDKLLQFFGELLIENIEFSHARSLNPIWSLEEGRCRLTSLQDFYNTLVVELLGVLPDEHNLRQKLTKIFQVRQVVPDRDDGSYAPLRMLWQHSGVSEYVKSEIDMHVRQQISHEKGGYDRLNVIDGYIESIRTSCNAYSESILDRQLIFLMHPENQILLPGAFVEAVLKRLKVDELYSETCDRVVDYVIKQKNITLPDRMNGGESQFLSETTAMLAYLLSSVLIGEKYTSLRQEAEKTLRTLTAVSSRRVCIV